MADCENGGDRMPGYVIHLAEAELILDKMRKLRQTDEPLSRLSYGYPASGYQIKRGKAFFTFLGPG